MDRIKLLEIDLEKGYYKGIYQGQEFIMENNNFYMEGVQEKENKKKEIIEFTKEHLNEIKFDENGRWVDLDELKNSNEKMKKKVYLAVIKKDDEEIIEEIGAIKDKTLGRWFYFSDGIIDEKFEKWIPKYLEVEYKDKNIVQKLGAKWDNIEKKWYYTNPEEKSKFLNWIVLEDNNYQNYQKTIEDKSNELDDIMKQLSDGVHKVLDGEEYKKYLKVMARIPQYSFRNTIMIYMQNPDASIVMAAKKMESNFGHKVKESELKHPINLLRPNKYEISINNVIKEIKESGSFGKQFGKGINIKESGKEFIVIYGKKEERKNENELEKFLRSKGLLSKWGNPPFIVFKAYDISQAEAIMLKDNKGNIVEHAKAKEYKEGISKKYILDYEDMETLMCLYEAIARVSKFPITYESAKRGENGYFSREEQRINITPSITPTHAVKTLIHELAHSILHNEVNDIRDSNFKQDAEVQAESIAYVICNHYGIDTAEYSFDYIAKWGNDTKEVEKSFDIIQKTAKTIIDSIDTELDRMIGIDIYKEGRYIRNTVFNKIKEDNISNIKKQIKQREKESISELDKIKKGMIIPGLVRKNPMTNRYGVYMLYPDGDEVPVSHRFLDEDKVYGIEKRINMYIKKFSIENEEDEICFKVYNEKDFNSISDILKKRQFDFFGQEQDILSFQNQDSVNQNQIDYEEAISFALESMEKEEKLYSYRNIQTYIKLAEMLKITNMAILRKIAVYDAISDVDSSFINKIMPQVEKEVVIQPKIDDMLEVYKDRLIEDEIELIKLYSEVAVTEKDAICCLEETIKEGYGIRHNAASDILYSVVMLAIEKRLQDESIPIEKKTDLTIKKENLMLKINKENIVIPGKNVEVTLYQVKEEYLKEYGNKDYTTLIQEGSKIELSNYIGVAGFRLEKIDDINVIPECIYELGTYDPELGDMKLRGFEFDNIEQKMRCCDVGDIIKVSAEGQMDKFFYTDNIGFRVINFKENEIDEECKKFLEEYKMFPSLTIKKYFPDVSEMEAKVISEIDKDILPLPQKYKDMQSYKINALHYAKKVLKNPISVMIGSSESSFLKKGDVFSLEKVSVLLQCEEYAIQNIRKKKGEDSYPGYNKTDMIIFVQKDKSIMSYHFRYDIGTKSRNIESFLIEDMKSTLTFMQKAVKTGKVYKRDMESDEVAKYYQDIGTLSQMQEMIYKHINEKQKVENKEMKQRKIESRVI